MTDSLHAAAIGRCFALECTRGVRLTHCPSPPLVEAPEVLLREASTRARRERDALAIG